MHKYKKGEYRDQFVIAYIYDLDDYQEVVKWSIKFSTMLKKGLILLYICDEKYTNVTTTQAQERLQVINSQVSLPYVHSYAALKGKTKDIIGNLGDLLSAVMVVTKSYKGSNKKSPIHYNNIIEDFASSRIAYFVFDSYKEENNFQNVVLSMNALKECKEKILWASYFGRFANSITYIYYHRYRDEYLQKQLNLNIGFLRKLFRKFSLQTRNIHSLDRRTKLDVQALRFAKENNYDICIFQTTKNKSFIEFFTGLPERMVLIKQDNTPVLFLNQRDDLFVLCE